MQEGDAFAFRADTGCLVDEPNAGGTTPLEGGVDVVDGEADVMDSGAAFGDKSSDRGFRTFGFEQFDERLTGREACDGRSVGVVERYFWQVEDVAIERQYLVEGPNGDSDVRDSRSPRGGWHAHFAQGVMSART